MAVYTKINNKDVLSLSNSYKIAKIIKENIVFKVPGKLN